MKDGKKITRRQLRRMLGGRNYIRLVAYILLAMFPGWVYLNRDSGEFARMTVFWLFAIIFFFILSGMRAGRARRSVSFLRDWNELDQALADLNSEGVYRIPRPSYSSEQTADNVLGEKFIFLFSCGRILRYYQIDKLLIWRGANKLQLNIIDTTAKACTLAELPSGDEEGLAECLHQLKARYPGCPRPTESANEVITL